MPAKERVLGVLTDNENKAYSINLFETDRVIEDIVGGSDILVIGSKSDNYIVAYEKGALSNVRSVAGQLPIVAEDDNGNKISISGAITEGPSAGTQLGPTRSFIAYWIALGAFYPELELYED